MRYGNKTDILRCLEPLASSEQSLNEDLELITCIEEDKDELLSVMNLYNQQSENNESTPKNGKPTLDATIFDGAFIVQALSPPNSCTFQEYADNIFIPAIVEEMKYVQRVDVVWGVTYQKA